MEETHGEIPASPIRAARDGGNSCSTAAGGAAGFASALALREPPAYAQTRELTFLTVASFVPETDKELKRQFEDGAQRTR